MKRLVIRLSSLGDLVLSTSALRTEKADDSVDWLTSKEYVVLLQEHPKIEKIWDFDRKLGLRGWVKLCREIWESGYDEIYDLHLSLRTRLARILFWYWTSAGSMSRRRPDVSNPSWHFVSKLKMRFHGYMVMKRWWPKRLRPTPWTQRYAMALGGIGDEVPHLQHLIDPIEPGRLLLKPGTYFCVMPSSRWSGKEWPAQKFFDVIQILRNNGSLKSMPVVLGASGDLNSLSLMDLLNKNKVEAFSGVGRWNLKETANILFHAQFYLGCDTGLSHLAAAVGTPVFTVLGPTVSDMGYSVIGSQSRTIGLKLGCRPCGKDGRFCTRIFNRHVCLKGLSASDVAETLSPYLYGKNLHEMAPVHLC